MASSSSDLNSKKFNKIKRNRRRAYRHYQKFEKLLVIIYDFCIKNNKFYLQMSRGDY